MRKKKTLCLILTAVLTLSLFAGCKGKDDTPNQKSILDMAKEAPAEAIQNAEKLTLSKSPFASLPNTRGSENVGIKVNANYDGSNIEMGLVSALGDVFSMSAYLKAQNPDKENADQWVKLSTYVDETGIGLNAENNYSDVNKESIGVKFKDIQQRFLSSDLYNRFIKASASEEEISEFEEMLESGKISETINTLKNMVDKLSDLVSGEAEYAVTEETITINEADVACVKIVQTTPEETQNEIVNTYVKLAQTLLQGEPQLGSETDTLSNYIKAQLDSTTTYYINAKTGALVKIVTTSGTKPNSETADGMTQYNETTIDFGKNPEKTFSANVTSVIESADGKQTMTAQFSEEGDKFKIAGSIVNDLGDTGNFVIFIDKENKFEVKYDTEYGYTISITGNFEISESDARFSVSDLKVNDEPIPLTLSVEINYKEDAPEKFEFTDILDMTEEEIVNSSSNFESILTTETTYFE